MNEDEAQQPTEAGHGEDLREELRRGDFVQHVAEYAIAYGGVKAIELCVEAAVDKIKDARTPKDEGQKIERPYPEWKRS